MAECSVCLNDLSADGGCRTVCNHDFCYECVARWNEFHHVCPMCREPLLLTKFPRKCDESSRRILTLQMRMFAHAGITLRLDGSDIVVVRVHPKDAAHAAGIRQGDCLHRINSLACRRPDEVAAVFDKAAAVHTVQVCCEVERRLGVFARFSRRSRAGVLT